MTTVSLIQVSDIIHQNLDWDHLSQISQTDLWLIKSQDFFQGKDSIAEAKRVIAALKPTSKLSELCTWNSDLVLEILPDCLLVTSDFTLEQLFGVLETARACLDAVSFRITDSPDPVKNQEVLQKVLAVYQKFPSLLFLLKLDFTSPDWWISRLPASLLERLYLHSTPACLGQKFNLPFTQARITEIADQVGFHSTSPKSQVMEMGKKAVCQTCPNTRNCLGFLRQNKTLPALVSPVAQLTPYRDNIAFFRTPAQKITVDSIVISPEQFQSNADLGLVTKKHRLEKDQRIFRDCIQNQAFKGHNFLWIGQTFTPILFKRIEANDPMAQQFSYDPKIKALSYTSLHFEKYWSSLYKPRVLHPHFFIGACLWIQEKVMFDSTWSLEKQKALDSFFTDALKEVISRYGDLSLFSQRKEALYYNGYRFYDRQWKFIENYGLIMEGYLLLETSENSSADLLQGTLEPGYNPKFLGLKNLLPAWPSEGFSQELQQKFIMTFKEYVNDF